MLREQHVKRDVHTWSIVCEGKRPPDTRMAERTIQSDAGAQWPGFIYDPLLALGREHFNYGLGECIGIHDPGIGPILAQEQTDSLCAEHGASGHPYLLSHSLLHFYT